MNSAIDFPWDKSHNIGADEIVKTGPCVLHNVTINGTTTVGDMAIYDGVDNTGTLIATIALRSAVQVSIQPITLNYDCAMADGIFLEHTAWVGSITVTHK